MSDTISVSPTLLDVQGTGPATASAMLTAVSASLPFMSDEALAAALPARPDYTVKKYLHLVTALRTKAESLSNSSGQLSKGTQDVHSFLRHFICHVPCFGAIEVYVLHAAAAQSALSCPGV